jgi:hypothetical protein
MLIIFNRSKDRVSKKLLLQKFRKYRMRKACGRISILISKLGRSLKMMEAKRESKNKSLEMTIKRLIIITTQTLPKLTRIRAKQTMARRKGN